MPTLMSKGRYPAWFARSWISAAPRASSQEPESTHEEKWRSLFQALRINPLLMNPSRYNRRGTSYLSAFSGLAGLELLFMQQLIHTHKLVPFRRQIIEQAPKVAMHLICTRRAGTQVQQ